MFKRAAGKNVKQSGYPATGRLRHRSLKPFVQNVSINPRDRDRGAGADNDQHGNRKKNALPKLRNFEDIREGGDHGENNWLFANDNRRSPCLLDLLTRSLAEFVSFDG